MLFWSGVQRGNDEEAETEGFGGTDACGNGEPELDRIGNGQFALKFNGSVCAPGGGVLVEELPAPGTDAEGIRVDDEAPGLSLAQDPGFQIGPLDEGDTAAVLLTGTIGKIHPELLCGIGQQGEPVGAAGEEILRDELCSEAIGGAA